MEQSHQMVESLLKYLSQVEEAQGTNFGTTVTAGALADQLELQRMFALPDERLASVTPRVR
jgi:hypothetical protein